MRYFKTLCVYSLALSFTVTCNYVSKIEDCPSLSSRSTPADSVFDLRPDDIKVVGALGDR
jgi:phospholipase B1